jgi:hypothetical protein
MSSGQPSEEILEVRARRLHKENESLRLRLRRCQWFLEACTEAMTLDTAKELASEGLMKSLAEPKVPPE